MAQFPRDVECPLCKAKVDHGCRSLGSFSIPDHVARWKTIGVPKPTQEQKDASYHDGIRRDDEIRKHVFARLRKEAGMVS